MKPKTTRDPAEEAARKRERQAALADQQEVTQADAGTLTQDLRAVYGFTAGGPVTGGNAVRSRIMNPNKRWRPGFTFGGPAMRGVAPVNTGGRWREYIMAQRGRQGSGGSNR